MRQKVITFTRYNKECRIVLKVLADRGMFAELMRLKLDTLNKEHKDDYQKFSLLITKREAKKLRDALDDWISE